ncbi:hypothetical protein IFM89_034280 [Coptis chinensis]|uniref:Uncharacterized protein n=1 Tax=Coptis chinensis TaxID=261450 RepID=A0A835ITL4_9MAGN|nr:hypothetical protein IFM89_034280 [Coptis chinensis]
MDSWIAMKAVIRVQTFQIIVLQGIVGSLPWTAMVFFIMRFELIGSFSSFAAPIVGILSEKIYGYDPKFVNPLFGSKQEAFALSRGLFSVMALPFGLCSLFYSPLCLTYKRDHESARLASLKEQESIHDTR